MSEARKTEPTFMENLTIYFKGVRAEWDKITWPEKKQVAVEMVIVLGVVFFFTFLVYIYDILFEFIFKFLS